MSGTSRMLGRWRSGGCGCKTPGPDCAGHDRDTRWRKRQEQRQVRREVDEALSDRASTTMDYGRADAPREAPIPEHLTLAQKAGAITVTVALVWAAAALVLWALNPQPHPAPGTVVWQTTTPAHVNGDHR